MQQWRIFLRSIDQQLPLRSPKLQMCRSNIWISSIVLNWWLYDTKCILILSYITLQFFRQYLKLVYIKIINYNGVSFANLKNNVKYKTSYEKPQTYSNKAMLSFVVEDTVGVLFFQNHNFFSSACWNGVHFILFITWYNHHMAKILPIRRKTLIN